MTWLSKPILARILKGVAVAWLLASFPALTPLAQANNWGEMVMVSATMGISDSRICIGEGRGDLGCPSYAPYVASQTGFMGIGNVIPSSTLHIVGISSTLGGLTLGDSKGITRLELFPVGNYSVKMQLHPGAGVLSIGAGTSSSDIFAKFDAQNRKVAIGQNFVGQPNTSLDISGTLRISDGGENCDSLRVGAIRYVSGDFEFCRNGTAWEALSAAGNGSVVDRIV